MENFDSRMVMQIRHRKKAPDNQEYYEAYQYETVHTRVECRGEIWSIPPLVFWDTIDYPCTVRRFEKKLDQKELLIKEKTKAYRRVYGYEQ